MPVKDRMKASDVFRETNYVFGKKVKFEEAFPEIKTLRVECTEEGYGARNPITRIYTEKNTPGEYIDCHNPLCYNGGFSIGQILREMVQKREKHWEGTKFCQGYEGSPKGRRKYRSCINSWKVKVDIEYK